MGLLGAFAACGTDTTRSTEGKTFVWVVGEDFSSLDTANIQSMGNGYADGPRASTLLTYDVPTSASDPAYCPAPPNPPKLKPTHLVKSWSVNAGGHEIDFTLNQGVTSQYGNTLTSADVQWSIQREAAIDPIGSSLMFFIAGIDKAEPITVTGPYTFKINVAQPTDVTDLELTEMWQEIYDMKAVQQNAGPSDPWGQKWLNDHVADFGPWKLSSFVPSQSVTYVPNPNFSSPRGNITKLVIQTVPSAATRSELIASGRAQAVGGLTFNQYATLPGSVGVVSCPSPARDYLGLNLRDPVFASPAVRKAVSLAIDRKALVQAVYRGFGTPALSGVSSIFNPGTGTSSFVYDSGEAKKLLTAAGYSSGFDLSIAAAPDTPGEYVTTLSEFLRAQLGAVGIRVAIATVPTASKFKADLAKGAYQAFIFNESPDFSDPGYTYRIWHNCNGLQNFTGWCNNTLDAIAAKIQATDTPVSERAGLIGQLSTAIESDVPLVPLVETPTVSARLRCITGLPTSYVSFNSQVYQAKSSC